MTAVLLLALLLLALPALVERLFASTGRPPYAELAPSERLSQLQLLDADVAVAPAAAKAAVLEALPNRAARRALARGGKLNVRQAAKCEAYAQRAARRYSKLAGA